MSEPDQPGSFYGRRKGKRLRPGHDGLVKTLLPRLRIELPGPASEVEPPLLDPAALFSGPMAGFRLEIGFGGGEHLAQEARRHPEIGFLGCEPFINGMAKLLAAVAEEGLDNIRVFDRDATELLPLLPAACVERVYLLYPDPWPKRRQRKRRFLNGDTLREFARILQPGGELRFATDIDDYAGWALDRVARSPAITWTAETANDWRRPWPDWQSTRYEVKAISEQRRPTYLIFRRA